MKNDCKFNHPSNKTTENNNDQEEDVFQDAKTDDVIQDGNGESVHSNKGGESKTQENNEVKQSSA